jgi:hypothetical protein
MQYTKFTFEGRSFDFIYRYQKNIAPHLCYETQQNKVLEKSLKKYCRKRNFFLTARLRSTILTLVTIKALEAMGKVIKQNGKMLSGYFYNNIGIEGCLGLFLIGCFLMFGQM